MLKKTITYTDYEGVERTEDFYFNLNKAEVIKWLTTSGGYTIDKLLQRLVKEDNAKQVMVIFEDLIKMSYGEKSLDGKRFVKNDELWEAFSQTEAYSELFIEEESPARNRCGRVPVPVRRFVLVRYRNRNPSPWEMFSIS